MECQAAVEAADTRIVQKQSDAETASEKFDEAHQAHEEVTRVKDQVEERLASARTEEAEAKEGTDKNAQAGLQLQNEGKKLDKLVKESTKKVKDAQRKVDEERKRIADADGGSHAQILAQIEQLQHEQSTNEDEMTEHKTMEQKTVTDVQAAQLRLKDIKDTMQSKRTEVEKARTRLNDLQRGGANKYAGFHPTLQDLLKRIANERGFREKPVGPLGAHIKLKNGAWSSVLETYIGNNLNGFVVTSYNDQQLLSRLANQTS